MARICKIVLICEGWEDSSFMRGFLNAAGVDSRNVTQETNPGGSGHDFVKRKFVVEVENMSRHKEGRGVLALIDEDGTGDTRKSEIDAELAGRNLHQTSPTDGICLLIPKRNIETWTHWLKANRLNQQIVIDETTNYKTSPPSGAARLEKSDFRLAGEHLHTLNHTQLPSDCPASLVNALKQLRDFLNAVRR